jgi:hypothetical protein
MCRAIIEMVEMTEFANVQAQNFKWRSTTARSFIRALANEPEIYY